MEDPTKDLGVDISNVGKSRNTLEDDKLGLCPFLESKPIHIHVACALCRFKMVGNKMVVALSTQMEIGSDCG